MAWSGYSEKGQGSDERGPGGFTYSPPGAVTSSGGRGAVGVQQTNTKVNDIDNITVAPAKAVDRTADVLLGFAAKKLAPHVQAMTEEAFVTGMQRAASGEALTEIVNEQPWYSKIFGDAPLVEGARLFEVQAGVTKWVTEAENRMPELRRVSPDAVPKMLLEATRKLQTGDPQADTAMQMEIIKQVPDFMKRHTREHYRYLQETAVEKRFDSWQSQAASLQTTFQAAEGMYTPEEIEQRQGNLLNALVPTAGADIDAWNKNLSQFVGWSAENGNFHTVAFLEKQGVFEQMPATDRRKLELAIKSQKVKHASEAVYDYAEPIMKLRMDADTGNISGKDLMAAFDELDAQYKKLSGNDHPLIPRGERLSGGMSAMRAVRAAQTALAKETLKAEGSAEYTSTIKQNFAMMTSKDMELRGIKRADVNTVGKEVYDSLPTPEAKAAWLVADARGGNVIDTIKADFDVLYGSADHDVLTDNFLEAHKHYQAMRSNRAGGSEAISLYLGKDVARRMDDFSMQLGGRDPTKFGEQAFQLSRKPRMHPGYTMDQKERKATLGWVDDEVRNNAWYNRGVGDLTESAKNTIIASMSSNYGQLKTGTPPKVLNRQSYEYAKADGLEMWGRHAWYADKTRPRLEDYMRDVAVDDPRLIAATFDKVVADRIKAFTDKSPSDVMVLRSADSNGAAHFVVHAYTDDGMLPPTVFSTDDLKTEAVKERQARIARRMPGTTQLDAGPVDVTKPFIGTARP